MLLAAEMGPAVARSSMERMLDAIRLRDERPEGAPPALPARPTSRARLPSSRRPLLPIHLKAGGNAPDLQSKACEKRVESTYGKMPELESYEGRPEGADGSDSPPDAKLGWGDTTDHVLKKIVALEDARSQNLQGILWVQKRFRGLQAHRNFQELKKGVSTLQSFIRGERARREFEYMVKRWKAVVLMQKHVKRWIARKTFYDQQEDIILLQSVIRGWLARRHFIVLKDLEMRKLNHMNVNRDPDKALQEIKDATEGHSQVCPSVLAELQGRVLKAEAAVRQKEEENAMLQKQLQQYETRWSEYEAKMKSMEETWQKQLTSLQMSLAAAKKSLVADDVASQPGKLDASPNHHCFDSEDTMSAETHTPEGTPPKLSRASDARLSRKSEGTKNAVSHLINEFEQRRQAFEDDAGFLIEVKSGTSHSTMNPNEEFQNLKVRFAAWKKDYKVRLRETKAELQKFGSSKSGKTRRKWWATICTR